MPILLETLMCKSELMNKIIKSIIGLFTLVAAGCNTCHHCGDSCCHHGASIVNLKHNALYKLVLPGSFDRAKGDDCVVLTDLDRQSGFIHASYGHQVARILGKFFADAHEVVALELDVTELIAHGIQVKPEANKPGGDIFPHLYGVQKIPVIGVKDVKVLKKNAAGDWETSK